ncbi:MAG: hypothetical protein M0D57_12255 [Sphingobacteriales bacterium JAD_PAG50586_3]|nr:MAG: hypothetical protein M0D57_12255 [Sphingobacteriales bacterium JAD_PAG50586_3]
MNIQQAKAEVSSALVEVADQLETILNHKAKIPQIEMDLILSNTQRLYNFLLVLNKLNATGKVDGPGGQQDMPAVKQEEIAKIIHTEVSKLREELFRTVTNPNKGAGVERMEPVTEPVTEPQPFSTPPAPAHKPQTQTGPSPEKLAAIKQNPFIGKTIMPNGVVEEKVAVATPVEVKPIEVEQLPVVPEHIAEVAMPAPVVAAPVVEAPVIKFEEPVPQPQPLPQADLTKTFVTQPVQQPVASVNDNVTADTSLVNKLRAKPITNIKSAIGINDKFQYLNDLFKGSVQDYNESLDALNNLGSLPEAEAHFNQLRVKFGWDMENASAAGLYELVVRRHLR